MTTAAHIEVILNPAASSGAGARLRPRVEEELERRGLPFRLRTTESARDALQLGLEACRSGAAAILVAGGDGTIHEVANGILSPSVAWPPPPVAIVPVGTGNDFYRLVGSVRRVDQAVDALVGGQLRYFDVGRVRFQGGESLFVNLLGVGVDVEVLRRREGFRRLKGLPQYLAALVSALARFRPHEIRIELEGPAERIEGRTLLTAVTVGPSVGGGFLLSPAASAEDGLLDLFFAPTLGPVKLVRYIPRVIRGTHQDLPELRQRRFARGRLERPDGEPFFFELDGERMPDPVRALEIDVLPGRLPILLPPRGS